MYVFAFERPFLVGCIIIIINLKLCFTYVNYFKGKHNKVNDILSLFLHTLLILSIYMCFNITIIILMMIF